MIQQLGGVLHAVTVGAEVVPLVAIFWTLFVYCDVPLKWDPEMQAYTWVAMVGFIILLPPVIVFGYNLKRESPDGNHAIMADPVQD